MGLNSTVDLCKRKFLFLLRVVTVFFCYVGLRIIFSLFYRLEWKYEDVIILSEDLDDLK